MGLLQRAFLVRHKVLWLQLYVVVSFLLSLCHGAHGMRGKRFSNLNDDATIHTEYVGNNRTILAMFNLTEAEINRITAAKNLNEDDQAAQQRDSQYFNNIKEYRLNDIKNRLESAFQVSKSEENQEHPQHEMAAYPICNSESNEASWMHDNNVTIRFSGSLFEPKRDNLNLDSAILRLYKINPNGTDDPNADDETDTHKPKRCAEPFLDSQIRVTVSIIQRRNKRERKKRICNTIMMNVSKTGWVEIDIKRAIYIWESVERQQQMQHASASRFPILVGLLLIEVHDEEERPLKPGLFFKPPKCDQADLAIPWNYYRPHTAMSPFAANEVPRYPRLDVKLIGYASFAPKHYNREQQQKLRDNLRRQLYNLSKNSAELLQTNGGGSTTSPPPAFNHLLEGRMTDELPLATAPVTSSIEMPHFHRKRHSHSPSPSQPQSQSHAHNHNAMQLHTQEIEDASSTEEPHINQHQHQPSHQHHHLHKRHNHRHRPHSIELEQEQHYHHQHQQQKEQQQLSNQ